MKTSSLNKLVAALHVAFSKHLPVELSPDIIWITIAQGFAQHVTNNAEKLRNHFVAHEGIFRQISKLSKILKKLIVLGKMELTLKMDHFKKGDLIIHGLRLLRSFQPK